MGTTGRAEEGNGLDTEEGTEDREIIQSLGPDHVLDTALFQSVFRSLGGDDAVYHAPVVRPSNLFLFPRPCAYLPEVPRKELVEFLSVSDGDFLEEYGFGGEHVTWVGFMSKKRVAIPVNTGAYPASGSSLIFGDEPCCLINIILIAQYVPDYLGFILGKCKFFDECI